jgi:hypothetical protein
MTLTVSRTADASTTLNAFCDVTSISLAGNPGTTGTWTYTSKPATAAVPTITAITGENALADNISKGTYIFNYSLPAIGACPSTNSSRTINIYTAATSLADAGTDISLCTGTTTATLTGSIPATGTAVWNLISGPNTPTPVSANALASDTSLSNLAEGLYLYRYSINTNTACAASADTVMIIKEKTANAQPDQRLCNVTAASLAGNAPVYSTGSWLQVSGPNTATILLPNAANTQVTGLVSGTYVFSWTIAAAGACPASSSNVQIIVDAAVAATGAGPDVTICPASTSPVLGTTASGGVTYLWSPATYLSNATVAQPNFTGTLYPGTFTYTLNTSSGSCTASDQVVVTVRAYPADFSVSKSTYTTFTAVNAGVGASYLWDFGSGSSPATANAIGPYNVTYSSSGTKTASLTVTDANSCTNTKTLSFSALASSLPLHLLSFTAAPDGSNVVLNWTTADAVNVSLFSIERSTDGIAYSAIGSVLFSISSGTYSFTDVNILSSANSYYYRLRTVDNDGNFMYSTVRIIKSAAILNQPAVSPNPFINQLTVTINMQRNESTLSVTLLDGRGAIIITKKFTGLKEGVQQVQLTAPGYLSRGLYILQLKTEKSRSYYLKTMKQ